MKFERPTGLMFHHFHDDVHPEAQGSIDAGTFGKILDHIQKEHRILPAQDWFESAVAGSLTAQDVCITFDDALACQYDVAGPVLAERGLTAFWFVYTSVLEGGIEPLEIFRLFRTTRFSGVEAFYARFFGRIEEDDRDRYREARSQFDPEEYLKNAPFYSHDDRWFRYLRDNTLTADEYEAVMFGMMDDASFSIEDARKNLWLTAGRVKDLAKDGHVIGLHSHTHPTTMAKLSPQRQRQEYERNYSALTALLGKRPLTVSHPCNSYSQTTLEILRSLDIEVGFRADSQEIDNRSLLEFSREDHANICRHLRDIGELAA